TAGYLPAGSATIPEIALVKRTNQQGVCKIAAFAYDRMSGRPVWQSGNRKIASRAKDIWVMGAGPFQRGTIYEGTAFAGEKFNVPLVGEEEPISDSSVASNKVFLSQEPQRTGVENAGYLTPIPTSASGSESSASASSAASASSSANTPASASQPA